MLRPDHEAEGSQAAPVVRLTRSRWVIEGVRLRDGDGRRLVGGAIGVVEGRIAAIGPAPMVRRRLGDRAERIDFGGATALPGLVDPHVHVAGMAARESDLDCARARSVAELLRAVRARHRRMPAGTWLQGSGLDESRLGRLPTAAELDRAAPGRAVRLRHRSRHASVLSSAGLVRLRRVARAGLAAPRGLVAGRERAVARAVGPLPDDVLVAGLRSVAAAIVGRGVTCVGDASPRSRRAAQRFAALLEAAAFAPRVTGMGTPTGACWPDDGRLGYAGVKIVVEDDADGLRPRPETLRRLVRAAARDGRRVVVHCVTLATLAAALEAFGALPAEHRRGRGHRLEHLAECPPALVGEIARLGLTVVTNPPFVYWRGGVYHAERSVPPGWLYRARSLTRAGVPVAGASDAPVTPCDPWGVMAAARERRTRGGRGLGCVERLGAAAALALVCREAAVAAGRPDLGRLAVGGPADVVVVDRDPVASPAAALRDARVLFTMIDGEPAWSA